jgi:hypothetical protein
MEDFGHDFLQLWNKAPCIRTDHDMRKSPDCDALTASNKGKMMKTRFFGPE